MEHVIFCSAPEDELMDLNQEVASLGGTFSCLTSVDDLIRHLSSQTGDPLLVFDIGFFESIDDRILRDLERKVSRPFILVSAGTLNRNIIQLQRCVKIEHVIASASGPKRIDSLIRLLQEMARRKNSQQLGPADVPGLFNIDPSRIKRAFLTRSDQRWDCYKELSKHVDGLCVFPGYDDIAATVASELIINAFYNGPRDPHSGLALHPTREHEVALEAPKSVEFSFWSTDSELWLMVVDPFGTLRRSHLVSAIHRVVNEGTAKLDLYGGAGLGLTMIATWASELLFCLYEKEATWVACKLRVTKRRKGLSDRRSNLHIYEIKDSRADV